MSSASIRGVWRGWYRGYPDGPHPVGLRAAAERAVDTKQARRILAIAMVLDGYSREDAAQACGMDRQTLRDWVHRYNEAGLAGQCDDMTITAAAFAVFDPPAARIFITENEINFLAFPPVEGSLIIFGAGYGLESLQRADWLKRRRIYYWGDIDTHGFVILDQLRRCFAHVSSMLMDQETFVLFRHLWGREQAPVSRDLATLTPAEHQLYRRCFAAKRPVIAHIDPSAGEVRLTAG